MTNQEESNLSAKKAVFMRKKEARISTLALRWAREPQPDLMMEVVPLTAQKYLLMHGWQYAFNNTVNGQRFTHKRSGFGDAFVVTSKTSPDYALRTFELIRAVAVVSLLSQFDVWAEMIKPDGGDKCID